MPSIDNNLVRTQAAELTEQFGSPEAFIKPLRRMLQQHADPALRQSLVVSIHSPLNGFGTPLPVLRTVRNALRKNARRDPLQALALADVLWANQSREERWLAAEIIGLVVDLAPQAVTDRLVVWLGHIENFDVADALATSAGGPWLRTDPGPNLRQIRTWVTVGNRYQQRYAIGCLIWLAQDRTYGDVVAVLDVLPRSLYQVDPEVRKVIAQLLRQLSLRDAAPVVRLLRDWANTLDRNAHWVVRHALDNLDEDTRQGLLMQLRGKAID